MDNILVELQSVSATNQIPVQTQFQTWVEAALAEHVAAGKITIRVVDEEDSAKLNKKFRGKTGPTNVLSFPFDSSPLPADNPPLLGEIVICAPIVEREARLQGLPILFHWAHMVIHACLHLMGFDHETDQEAKVMEGLEQDILRGITGLQKGLKKHERLH